jgi:hypothetical protein
MFINLILFLAVAVVTLGLGYVSVLLSKKHRLLVFVPAALILVVAFVISGLPEFLSFISFEVLFALALLKLLSGLVTGLFALFYFWKSRRIKV